MLQIHKSLCRRAAAIIILNDVTIYTEGIFFLHICLHFFKKISFSSVEHIVKCFSVLKAKESNFEVPHQHKDKGELHSEAELPST